MAQRVRSSLFLAMVFTASAVPAAAQPLQPVQLLDTFTKPPSGPNSALVQVPDGSFYGLTADAIYRVAPGGQVTIAARLTDGWAAQGKFQVPIVSNAGSLVRGPDGALYGATQFGGSGGRGTVFRYDPVTSEVRTLHAFDGANEGVFPLGGVVVSGGFLYGVTSGDISHGNRPFIFRTRSVDRARPRPDTSFRCRRPHCLSSTLNTSRRAR